MGVDRWGWHDAVWSAPLKPLEKLVALAFADHAGRGTDDVFVAGERLRARTGLSRDAASRALRGLEAAGWLVVVEAARQHRSTRYRLEVPGAVDNPQRSASQNAQPSASRNAEQSSVPSPDASVPSPDASVPSPVPEQRQEPRQTPPGPAAAGEVWVGALDRTRRAVVDAAVPADLVDRVVALAMADPDTQAPAARFAKSPAWRSQLIATARGEGHARDRDRRAARSRAIADCPDCHGNHWVTGTDPAVRCDHRGARRAVAAAS